MYLVDYHTHPYSHGEQYIKNNYNEILLKEYINTALDKDIKEIGFSDHDEFIDDISWNLIDEISKNSPIKVLKAIEFDYIPGREELIKKKSKNLNLDYTIGSVHFIDGWGFDNPEFISEYQKKNIDECFERYYELLLMAIESNLFNIIAHFDLIKIFAFKVKNKQKIDNIINKILKKIKNNNLVLELNTNGLNKTIKEIYPSKEIIQKAYQIKIPFTLSSDAHRPNRVGENIEKSARLLKNIGYKEIAVFDKRNLSFKPL
ncbi:histidinol-phosphatase HisJ family protein [Natronospora cellulosivora (SeqCode)]